ncbi:MAG: hypothetical protein SVR08_06525 [Spirochaetota bacterium]|nr:hypothetical protein [Spirochaetota bacterium]
MKFIKLLLALYMICGISLITYIVNDTPLAIAKSNKLPYNMRKPVKDINRLAKRFEHYKKKGDYNKMKSCLDTAKRSWREIEKNQKKYPGTYPEVEKAKAAIAQMETNVSSSGKKKTAWDSKAKDDKAKNASAAKEWENRFKEFYYGSNRPSFYNGTYSIKEFAHQQKLYNEISALMREYEGVGSPGKDTLERSNNFKTLERSLVEYSKYKKESENRIFEKILRLFKQFKQRMSKGLPIQRRNAKYAKKELTRIRAENSKYNVLSKAKIDEVEGQLNSLLNRSDKKRKDKAKNTFMEPDKYSGKDVKKIKSKAESILKKMVANSKTLRTVIIRKDWEQLSEWKWTDTSKSARYFHVYRQLKAQIAAKVKDEVRLYFVYIFQDKKRGKYGPLYGHILDYYHLIAEKNVDIKR